MTAPTLEPVDTAADLRVVSSLLNARSIAVIGASDDAAKVSGRPIYYLDKYGFSGAVYPINPNRPTVQGHLAYPSVADLPEVPDLAVIVVPQQRVLSEIQRCAAAGIGTAIVFASGYAEVGAAGAAAQAELTRVARAAGIRVIGPNCVGTVGVRNNIMTAFMSGLDQDRFTPRDDGVAFVSQSGAMGAFIFNMAQTGGIGLGAFISTGNEADVTLAQVISGLAQDPRTRVILGYIEGIRDGEEFAGALALAQRRNIPVCLMKVGRTERGALAAASHTGSLAGQDGVYDGVFAKYGVHRALTVDALLDMARLFSAGRPIAGNRVAILTLSGGAGVLMTDSAEDFGLLVPRWTPEWSTRIGAVLPSIASTGNPIDATGVIATDPGVLTQAVLVCDANPDSDVVAVLLGNMDKQEDMICEALIAVNQQMAKALIVVWVGGSGRPLQLLQEQGIAAFSEPVRAMQAISWGAARAAKMPAAQTDPGARECSAVEPGALECGAVAARELLLAGGVQLDEVAGKEVLAAAGIPVVRETAVNSSGQAALAAAQLGFPVAVKLLSAQVMHKSELGVVRLRLRSEAEVVQAADEVLGVATDLGLADSRLVVQQMIFGESELILGMKHDETFGPVVLVGFGGILTEVIADVQIRPTPVTAHEAGRMIDSLRFAALLGPVRGRPAVDRESLIDIIVRFSQLADLVAPDVESMEINPLLIDRDGRPVAVDALILRKPHRANGGSDSDIKLATEVGKHEE